MSGWSRAIAAGQMPVFVMERRRANYSALDQRLRGSNGYAPVWDALPDGTCPLFLPVRVRNRSEVMRGLAKRGIESFRFGASSPYRLDEREYPEVQPLQQEILCLPVHQDLAASDVERIAAEFAALGVEPAVPAKA